MRAFKPFPGGARLSLPSAVKALTRTHRAVQSSGFAGSGLRLADTGQPRGRERAKAPETCSGFLNQAVVAVNTSRCNKNAVACLRHSHT